MKKGRTIWKDESATFKKWPDFLIDAHYFHIPSNGHKNKVYSIKVFNEPKVFIALQDEKNSRGFVNTLSKYGWNRVNATITTSCCEINSIWESTQIKKGMNTISLPKIETDEFRLLILIAGISSLDIQYSYSCKLFL